MLKPTKSRLMSGTAWAALGFSLALSVAVAQDAIQDATQDATHGTAAADTTFSIPLPPEAPLSADAQGTADRPVASETATAPVEPAVIVELPPAAPLHLETATPAVAAEAPAPAPTVPAQAAESQTAPAQPAPEQTASIPAPVDQSGLRDRIRAGAAALVETDQGRTAKAQSLRREREAVVAFYGARDNAPLWTDGKALTKAGASLLARLERANEDGIDLPDLRRPSALANDEQAAAAELALTTAAITYALQASGARIDPRSIGLITAKPEIPEVAAILAALSAEGIDAGERLAAFNPPHAGYTALRDKLAELRREHPAMASKRIGPGPDLRVGMKDRRVPLLRARLGVDAESENDPLLYDVRVASAVADFNRANGLPAVNTLTARTIAKLSGGEPHVLEAELLSNMERWRWMPRNMGDTRIEVNIPDYQVKVTRNGEVIHRARVIVGKAQTPTPVFSHTMQHLIVNPYWNVPVSIIKKEMMPAYAKDPTYFQRRGYEVQQVRGQMVVRQPPGERNALGRIKFMFPNEHAVYLHDTPSRGLFANARRAYSHGCVRVDQPFRLAEVVLGKDNGWSEQRVRGMIGGGERLVNLPQHIPVHIEYFTAFVDDEGKVQLREDIYGYSRKVQAALGL